MVNMTLCHTENIFPATQHAPACHATALAPRACSRRCTHIHRTPHTLAAYAEKRKRRLTKTQRHTKTGS